MPRLDYGYVRSWDDPRYVQQLYDQGYAGALFAMDDPRLPQLVQQANQLGMQYGIWGAPNQTPNGSTLSPLAYAQRMAELQRQYNAQVMSLDLEFPYKGGPGTPGWNANTELAGYWKQMAAPGTTTLIAPMGSAWSGTQPQGQQDFNFGAWQGIASGWNPQAYGAMLTDHQDPQLVAQALINAGIDPSMVSPLLAPGQVYGGGALYGLNEFGDLPKAQRQGTPSPATGGRAVQSSGIPTSSPLVKNRYGQGATQTKAQVASRGLQWGGQNYGSTADFKNYLASKGKSYKTWASQHQQAAAGLRGRNVGSRPQ